MSFAHGKKVSFFATRSAPALEFRYVVAFPPIDTSEGFFLRPVQGTEGRPLAVFCAATSRIRH